MSRIGPAMRCPHCRKPATARTSHELAPVLREVTYQCRNLQCGHVWVCLLEAVRTLSPSAMPSPDVRLPLSRHINTAMIKAQLESQCALPFGLPVESRHDPVA